MGMWKGLRCAAIAALLISCGGNDVTPGPSAVVTSYLNDMVDIMEENSINRNAIDWNAFRAAVLEKAGAVQTVAEADAAVVHALELLNESTSFVVTVRNTTLSASVGCTADAPPTVPDDADIGYVQVPVYTSTGLQAAIFAKSLQGKVQTEDKTDLKGWIIDLRGNTGGNMWAMIAGVGPVLGEGIAGYFVDADGVKTAFQYVGGSMKYGEESILNVSFPYTVVSGKIKIAVLVDEATASSGEAVVISFIGRDNVQIFGANTCGKSAGNQPYILKDGSVLYLTTALLADRNENLYNGQIVPNQAISDPNEIYNAAVAWINE